MCAITENVKVINDVKVKTFGFNPKHGNADLDVEAGTTGPRGYVPREKSSRAYVGLDCNRGDFCFIPLGDEDGNVTGVGIACCGDNAVHSLMEALLFARMALMLQCSAID